MTPVDEIVVGVHVTERVFFGVAVPVNNPVPVGPHGEAVIANVTFELAVVADAAEAVNVAASVSHAIINPATEPAASALNAATFALLRALLKLTNTMDAKIPIMAITMRSSMRVKPLSVFFIIFFTSPFNFK